MRTFLSDLASLDPDDAFLVVERAAIIEFCGNVPRDRAELMAMGELMWHSTSEAVSDGRGQHETVP
jgi:hypothetical protein